MDILCSGTQYLEPVDEKTCLQCALEDRNDCGYGYNLLKSMFSLFEDDKRRNEIHVTDITSCLRKAYFSKTEPVINFVHDMLYLFIGIAVHNQIELNDEHVQSEVSFEKNGIHGRADAVFEDKLVDFKTSRWIKPGNLPYGEHEKQTQIYNTYFKKDRIQIQYIDLSGPTKCRKCKTSVRNVGGVLECPSCGNAPANAHLGAVLYEIPVVDQGDFIEDRVSDLQLALSNGVWPEAEPGWLCSYCPFTQCEHNEGV